MEFFRDAKYDFMGQRRFFLVASGLLSIAAIVVLFGLGQLNIGIDFAGGTQLTVRFQETPDVERLRGVLAEAGVASANIQRFGGEEVNEVMIKTPLVDGGTEGSRDAVVEALDRVYNPDTAGRVDLNQIGSVALASLLAELDPDGIEGTPPEVLAHYDPVAEAIVDEREEDGLLESWPEVASVSGVTEATLGALQERTFLGGFAVISAEHVGPQIGEELRTKGVLAVAFSMVGMLVYIWFRFELRFGIGAVVATIHDVTIALGLFAIANYEFNLTTIAAFLTLVGYSVNDTVVVFDRVRENMRRSRRASLIEVINESVNQTLSRTVLTSGTTLLTVGTLFLFGGQVIRGFAFVLLVGVIVGTYSTIYVAGPVVLLWEQWFGSRRSRQASRASKAA